MMSIDNLSLFYKGTQELPYSVNQTNDMKKSLVEYQFNTVDEDGNKMMDKLNREETIDLFKKVGSMYDDNAVVSISGDGLATLVKGKISEWEKQAPEVALKVRPAEDKRLNMTGNIITDRAVKNSLAGLTENLVEAAWGIVKEDLLNSDSGLAEEQRKSLIAVDMEKAKYFATNYLAEDKAKQFLSAMETIAKWGMNGKVNQDGKVFFDIKSGPMVEGMDDTHYVLKERNPELYQENNVLHNKLVNAYESWEEHKTSDALEKFFEVLKGVRQLQERIRGFLYTLDRSGKSPMEQYHISYNNWKRQMDNTILPDQFKKSDYSGEEGFQVSIMKQNETGNHLEADFLKQNLQKFFSQL